jgi:hypothetical protein
MRPINISIGAFSKEIRVIFERNTNAKTSTGSVIK